MAILVKLIFENENKLKTVISLFEKQNSQKSTQLRNQIFDLSIKIDLSIEKQNSNLINLVKTTNSKIKDEIIIYLSQTLLKN